MVSIVEIPVWIISSGYVRSAGLIEAPLISKKVSASTGGLQSKGLSARLCMATVTRQAQQATAYPPSIGLPDPLNTRPNISLDTGVFNTCSSNMNASFDMIA